MVFSYLNKDLCFHRRAEGTMHPASHQASQEHQLHPSSPSGNPIGPQQVLTQDLRFCLMGLKLYSFTSCGVICVGQGLAAPRGWE